jgi:hypothetical protein
VATNASLAGAELDLLPRYTPEHSLSLFTQKEAIGRLAWKVLNNLVVRINTILMNSGHLHVTSPAARSVRKTKAKKKAGRPRNGHNGEHAMAAAGTLTRTKSLLLAALRVWELKQRIGE